MKKWQIGFLLLSIIFFNGCTHKKEAQRNPNIILVLADDLGYGDLRVYTEKCKIQTPHLDQIASEGILFTDAHTTSAVCTPTRYSILTGRYNWRSSLKNHVLTGKSKALISTERTTLASLLKKAGYHTAFIGKWHLGWDWGLKDSTDFGGNGWEPGDLEAIDFSKPITNNPNDLGFDYAYGHCGSLDMPPYVYVENGKVTMIPDTIVSANTNYAFWRKGPISKDFIHEDVTPNFFRRSFDYIKKQAKTDEPFFLYLPLPSPHTPILPTEAWQGKSGLNPYGDFVMMIDHYMGQLAATIKGAGIEENTIVIFTSDNGCSPTANFDVLEQKGHAPNHIFRGHKADIYEGGHRVPFIVKWPDLIEKGTTSDQTISTADFMATFADIIGLPLQDNEGEDSYSLLPIFEQKELETPLREATVHHSINGSFAIRKGDWKLIMCSGSGGWSYPKPNDKAALDTLPAIQLYNLKEDPQETSNLYAENTETVAELKTLLTKYILEGRSTPGVPQENDPIKGKWRQINFINK